MNKLVPDFLLWSIWDSSLGPPVVEEVRISWYRFFFFLFFFLDVYFSRGTLPTTKGVKRGGPSSAREDISQKDSSASPVGWFWL